LDVVIGSQCQDSAEYWWYPHFVALAFSQFHVALPLETPRVAHVCPPDTCGMVKSTASPIWWFELPGLATAA
jgi:hypothetical protein